ncbi:MatE efflux family protein [Oceaniovalibus guishaninsula JLT2003]|uniref:MatE efflux family protein n=1 Tax=Oceaniovalibus guishaninsula JLT2003 TaxID=1231392 RepID=K2HTF4_9RHOB|nr:MatE efflux family protein [Oceaniovalibus guishaninsula JLT2003]
MALTFALLHRPLFSLLGASDAVMAHVTPYALWWALSFPFLVLMSILNAIFRARGDGVTAAVVMSAAAVLNIGLDPLLIFGLGPVPAMGTGGAGLATAIARIVAVLGAIRWARRQGLLGTGGKLTEGLHDSARRIFRVGLPAAFSNAINPMGIAAVTAAVATLGETAVAGFGAATRIQALAFVPLLALSSGIGPVVGQNWGADRQDRAARATRDTFAMCLAYGAVLAAVLFFFAGTFAGWVASGEDDTAIAAQYLRIVGFSIFGYGILITGNAALNARDRALWSMGLSLARIGLVYVPAAWVGVTVAGFGGIVWAAFAANLAGAAAALWVARRNRLFDMAGPAPKAPA